MLLERFWCAPFRFRIVGTSPFHKIALSPCQTTLVNILDMVGVVGSSPIAPTNTKGPETRMNIGFPGFLVFQPGNFRAHPGP